MDQIPLGEDSDWNELEEEWEKDMKTSDMQVEEWAKDMLEITGWRMTNKWQHKKQDGSYCIFDNEDFTLEAQGIKCKCGELIDLNGVSLLQGDKEPNPYDEIIDDISLAQAIKEVL